MTAEMLFDFNENSQLRRSYLIRRYSKTKIGSTPEVLAT
jgi:hypothetical protein